METQKRQRPLNWRDQCARSPHAVLTPVIALNWIGEWIAFLLGSWSFLEVLDHLGRFTVLVAVIFYFKEAPARLQQKHYQAWQVINTAQGKGGSGGRIEALQQLNHDHISLTGVDLSHAFLVGVRLEKAELSRANLNAADARDGVFDDSDLNYADLQSANLRGARLQHVSLQSANLDDVDLKGASLKGSNLSNAVLDDADLREADVDQVDWKSIKSVKRANIFGIKNAPAEFTAWALQHGAVQSASAD